VLVASTETAELAGNGIGSAVLAAVTPGTAELTPAGATAVLAATAGLAELTPAGALALVNS
jgi:hypothetical protein